MELQDRKQDRTFIPSYNVNFINFLLCYPSFARSLHSYNEPPFVTGFWLGSKRKRLCAHYDIASSFRINGVERVQWQNQP